MQRRRQAFIEHIHWIKVGEGRVQFLELLEVLENRRHQGVNDLIRHFFRADETGHDAEGFGRLRIVRVDAASDCRVGKVGIIPDQRVDRRAGNRHQPGAARSGWFLKIGGRAAHHIGKTIDPVVAQRGAMLVGLQLGSQ